MPRQQTARGIGIAQAYGEGAIANVQIVGFTAEQVQELLRTAGTEKQAQIKNLSQQLHTTADAVRGFLNILQDSDVPLEHLSIKLAEIAERHRAMLQRLAILDQDDPTIRRVIEQARVLLAHAASFSDYNRADALLAEAENLDMQAIQQAEDLEQQARQAAWRKRRSAAATRAERGELSLTRIDYLQAAQHFKTAADTMVGGADEIRGIYLNRQADALLQYGDEMGDNVVLVQSIDAYRQALSELDRQISPRVWAMTQNNLGSALQTLGERESGTERLQEAITAHCQALKEYTRERVPLDWAMTQNDLGNALSKAGARENSTERLQEAVTAFRQALKEHTRERMPMQWAMVQNNLGNTLQRLGRREKGTKRLKEAITAFRQALKELSRARVPLKWAMIQNNLGAALSLAGEREKGRGIHLLEQAVIAHRDALQERRRERVPLQWATSQNNLGNALRILGQRQCSTQRLEEAIAAYRDALQERRRERVPLQWATTQNNLGDALSMLGERESGTERLEEAFTAINLARIVFQEAGMLQYENSFKIKLQAIRMMIKARSSLA